MEGNNGLVLAVRAISSCLRQLRKDVDYYWKMRIEEAVGGELKDSYSQQLEYLTASTRHLQEAVSRGGCVRAI